MRMRATELPTVPNPTNATDKIRGELWLELAVEEDS
jgi:hypothetical protein